MSEFDQSRWAEESFSAGYRQASDDFLPHRPALLHTLAGFLRAAGVGGSAAARRLLDLGCGDGLVGAFLLEHLGPMACTLVDGSAPMLEAARDRLAGREGCRFVRASFQELINGRDWAERYRFIVSSLAIHHLDHSEKRALLAWCHAHLEPGGLLGIVDVVCAPDPAVESWQLDCWQEAISRSHAGSPPADALAVPQRYRDNPDNRPETLVELLTMLGDTGFEAVDCLFKQSIFAVVGGRRGG